MRILTCSVKNFCLIPVFLLACYASAYAGFDEGIAAYTSGDFEGAVREFSPMAEKGNAISQYHLGLLYEEGQGVSKSFASARQWYQKAADQGNADAMFALGQVYAEGLGVKKDHVAAYRWFDQAARNKHRLGPQERDRLSRVMSDSELAAARRLIGEKRIANIH